MDRSFIQVPRHVPRFKNLIKTSYYYIRFQESQDSLLNPIRTPPGVFLRLWPLTQEYLRTVTGTKNQKTETQEIKNRNTGSKTEGHGLGLHPFLFSLSLYNWRQQNTLPQFAPKDEQDGQKTTMLAFLPSTRPCSTRETGKSHWCRQVHRLVWQGKLSSLHRSAKATMLEQRSKLLPQLSRWTRPMALN